MTLAPRPLAFAAALLSVTPVHAQISPPPADAVLVLGALHDLHAREESFGYDRLVQILKAFRPDVVVLEVRPDELVSRAATPGRPEYPQVIWKWLDAAGVEAVAMEPGGKRFETIAGEAGAAFAAFGRRDAPGAAALTAFDDALETALVAYWRRTSETQDETTARIVDGHVALRAVLVGPAFVKAQTAWDDHMTQVMITTVRSRPSRRVLVVGSYRNRFTLEDAVRREAPARMVSAAAWLASVEASLSASRPTGSE
jgi:hypothetical protein